MTSDLLLFGGFATFAIIRFLVEPKLKYSARASNAGHSPGPAAIATLAATRFLGTFSGFAALGAGIGKALTYWVESIEVAKLAAEATPSVLDTIVSLLEFFQTAQGYLSKIGLVTATAPMILLVVGLMYWSVRSARSVDAAIQREIAGLKEKAHKGTLENLPPDERMREVEELIAKARANKADSESLEILYQLLLDLDLARRVDPSLLRLAGLKAPPEPLWLRAIGFMISGTVFKGMTRVAMVAAVLATISLIPASLIFSSKGLSEAVAQTTLELEDAERDITLTISDQNADADLDKFRTSNEPIDPNTPPEDDSGETWCDDGADVLSESDCKTAAKFGRIFETEWAARFIARSVAFLPPDSIGPGGQAPNNAGQSTENLAEARREWARRQVLLTSIHARATPSVEIVEAVPNDNERWKRAVLDIELTARSESRPVTRFGKSAEIHLRKILRVRPNTIAVAIEDRPLTRSALAAKAVSGAISAFIDLAGIEGQAPGPLDKALVGTFNEGLSALATDTVNRWSDAKYLAKAPDVAAKAIVVEALKTGQISDDTMRTLERFIDTKTAQRYQEALDRASATLLKAANSGRAESPSVPALETRVDQNIKRVNIEEALRKFGTEAQLTPVGALTSYSSIFPGVEGQAAHSLQAGVFRTLNPSRAEALYGPLPELTFRPLKGGGAVQKTPPSTVPSLMTIAPSPTTAYATDQVARARSYSKLRGFARVGGVLIGREPEDSAKGASLNLVEFSFSISPPPNPTLTMQLKHENGAEIVLGPYDPEIVHFALVYAADGRPTTVTMVEANPLPNLKILLHPALVDTKLGCRSISLDMFADTFGGSDDNVTQLRTHAVEETHGLVALYRQAWGNRFSVVTAELKNKFDFDKLKVSCKQKINEYNRLIVANDLTQSQETPDLESLQQRLTQHRRDVADFERQIERACLFIQLVDVTHAHALANEIAKSSPSQNSKAALRSLRDDPTAALQPLFQRPTYFDSDLVRKLKHCARLQPNTLTLDSISDCLRQTNSVELQSYETSEHFSWLAPPPTIVTWSGVRERPYNLDDKLSFARLPPSLNNGPLRFIVQNAIESPAFFSNTNKPWYQLEMEDIDIDLDAEPWEFESLQGLLQESVLRDAAENQEASSVLWDMYEFTVLQRLFRAAFGGRLGVDFPAEQLAVLAKETSTHINPNQIRTPRWNTGEGNLEQSYNDLFADAIERKLKILEPSYTKEFQNLATNCLNALRAAQSSAQTVLRACTSMTLEIQTRYQYDTSEPSTPTNILKLGKWLTGFVVALELRDELGVLEDWQKSSFASGLCSLPW